MELREYEGILEDFEEQLVQVFENREPAGLYDPISYFLRMKGKRIRPLLCLISARGIAGEYRSAMPVAVALEVFHNFTLMHDDIMDEAPTRRGLTTVHLKYNVAQAILSGDAMLIWAYRLVNKVDLSSNDRNHLLDRFSEIATAVCEGQQMDMEFEGGGQLNLAAYMRMIELKTAALLGASLEMGALAVGCDKVKAKSLYEFGKLLGMAFQMQDDWLDAFGRPEETGKIPGGDFFRKKKSLVFLKAMELFSADDKAWVEELYLRSGPLHAEDVVTILQKCKACEVDQQIGFEIEYKISHANAYLLDSGIPEVLVKELQNFALNMLGRVG